MVIDSYKRAVGIMHEMFDVMYQCSMPSISWYEILDIVDGGVKYSYDMHFLDIAECDGIYFEYQKKFGTFYRRGLGWQFLNYAPCGNPRMVIGKLLEVKPSSKRVIDAVYVDSD